MTISLMVAASENFVIGNNNQLPWHLPADMKFFKNTTWGMPVIMGRKTFESMGGRPLPGRVNIVITRQSDFQKEGIVVTHSWRDALFVAEQTDCKEVFVIGGGEIFQETLPKANRIYFTRVHTMIDGDTFFPEFGDKEWVLRSSRECKADDRHLFDYTFELWERRS